MRRLEHLARVGRMEVRIIAAHSFGERVEDRAEPLVADLERWVRLVARVASLPARCRGGRARDPFTGIHRDPPSGPGRRPDTAELPVAPERGRYDLLAVRWLGP